ncbi:Ribonuclease 3-like protein 3 [Linum perenne]
METSTAKPPNDDVSPPPPLEEVEEILGYSFEDRTWLEEALTHPSYHYRYGDEETEKSDGGVSSYERLEYVGDSVLNLIFTKEQFFRYPELMPGDLTRLRAANVDTEKLARVALKHGLFRYLRHKKLMLGDQIEEFSREIMEYPVHSNGLVNPPKTLADLVESLIGAVFIDSGCSVDTVWKVFKRLLEPIVEKETLKVHPVTELYEICQKRKLKLEFKGLWKEGIDVYVNDQFAGRGSYESKKEVAQNRAAKDALDNFGKIVVILSHEDEVDVRADNDAKRA